MDEKLKTIVAEKQKAIKLKSIIQDVEKKIKKKTKNSRKLIKAIDDFVGCAITNKAIYTKFEYMKNIMESMGDYANTTKA